MALLGFLPVEACINKCVLTLFCNIAVRQLYNYPMTLVFFLKCQENLRHLLPFDRIYVIFAICYRRKKDKANKFKYLPTKNKNPVAGGYFCKSSLKYLNPGSVKSVKFIKPMRELTIVLSMSV